MSNNYVEFFPQRYLRIHHTHTYRQNHFIKQGIIENSTMPPARTPHAQTGQSLIPEPPPPPPRGILLPPPLRGAFLGVHRELSTHFPSIQHLLTQWLLNLEHCFVSAFFVDEVITISSSSSSIFAGSTSTAMFDSVVSKIVVGVVKSLLRRQLEHVELTQQSPSQSTSSSHDNPKHLARQSTSPSGTVQHFNPQSCPGLHSFAQVRTTRALSTNNFNILMIFVATFDLE